jgi:hypothetical protein
LKGFLSELLRQRQFWLVYTLFTIASTLVFIGVLFIPSEIIPIYLFCGHIGLQTAGILAAGISTRNTVSCALGVGLVTANIVLPILAIALGIYICSVSLCD